VNKTWKVLLSLIGAVAAAFILVFANNISSYEPPASSTSPTSVDRQAAIAQDRAAEANYLVSENLGPGSGRTEIATPTPRSSTTDTSPLVTPGTSTRSLHEPHDTATTPQGGVAAAPEQPYQYEPPAPVQPAAPQPASPASTNTDNAVTPGAWCKRNMAGATGHSKNGVPMTCTYEGGEDVPRWRAS
jgi:cytoskeletal protein RodZ